MYLHKLKYFIVDGIWFLCLLGFVFIYLYYPSITILFSVLSFLSLCVQEHTSQAWTKNKVRERKKKEIQSIINENKIKSFVHLRPSEKCDLLKGLMIIITCIVMWSMDPSRIYHSIRGQAVLKLYVVFNVLEICDKLCCSVGVDILDALFSKSTLGNPDQGLGGAAYAKRQLKPITLFVLATGYMSKLHALKFFFLTC